MIEEEAFVAPWSRTSVPGESGVTGLSAARVAVAEPSGWLGERLTGAPPPCAKDSLRS